MIEIDILKKVKCPRNVIEHSKAVYMKAMDMAKTFDNVDLELIQKGSLLHDIGRCRTHGIKHAIEGAKIAKNLGYLEDVCNIIERHIGAGISESEAEELGLPKKSYIPQTLEEKIVAHSDNLINGTEEIDMEFLLKKLKSRSVNKESIERVISLHNELMR